MENRNPFNTGSPARGDGFFDRNEVIDDVILFINKIHEYNFVIFGQRRIGKTSLLRKLQDDKKLNQSAYPVYFNLQDQSRTPLSQLLFEIAKRIALDIELNIKIEKEDFTGGQGALYFKEKFIPTISSILGDSKRVLLLFDEFDVLEDDREDLELTSYGDGDASRDFIPFMVSLLEDIQQNQYPFKFVFVVGRNYKDLDPRRYGQLTKFGPQREISFFSAGETHEFLEVNGVIPFEKEAIAEIFRLTGGHPYFTQCLAATAFDKAEERGNDSIRVELVNESFIPTINSFSSGVYWVWDSLANQDRVILYIMAVLAEQEKPLNINTIKDKATKLNFTPALVNLPDVLERLKSFKFIKQEKEDGNIREYSFCVEFICKWIVSEVTEARVAKMLPDIDEEIKFHLHKGHFYFQEEKYEKAVEHFKAVLDRSTSHYEALVSLARSYKHLIPVDSGNLEKALSFYRKAYRLHKHETKKEYQDILFKNRDTLKNKDRYKSYKDEFLQDVYEEINKMRKYLQEIDKIKEKCDKVAMKKWKVLLKIAGAAYFLFVIIEGILNHGKNSEPVGPDWFVIVLVFLSFAFFIYLIWLLFFWSKKFFKKKYYREFGYNEKRHQVLKQELADLEEFFRVML